MLKRDGKVYTQIVKNCSASELIPILSQYSELDSSTIYSDCWKAYDGLVDYGAKAHYRVKHSKNEFANGKNHINGIENFWGYAKHRLSKFKGIKKENFLLHLKECEFRYNTKTTQEDLYQKLLKLIRENPLKFNWAKLNSKYRVIDYVDKRTDMQALLLERGEMDNNGKFKGSDNYIVAFRATGEVWDGVVDLKIGFKNINEQYIDALDFTNKALTKISLTTNSALLTKLKAI